MIDETATVTHHQLFLPLANTTFEPPLKLSFTKYHGTGNDFIVVDNRGGDVTLTTAQIAFLCRRRFGVGADGIILIAPPESKGVDFTMNYYNSDGSQSFCGNGSRCAVHFARHLGMVDERCRFMAIDGKHEAVFNNETIEISMNNTEFPEQIPEGWFVDTGSPHVLIYVDDVSTTDVQRMGGLLRYSGRWGEGGTNVNFIERSEAGFRMRTYERGVEAETFSCGTGATAAAIADAMLQGGDHRMIDTPGGRLTVRFKKRKNGFRDIWLGGPTQAVYEGTIEII